MIEPLQPQSTAQTNEPIPASRLVGKLNEIIDVVNELEHHYHHIDSIDMTEDVSHYAVSE